MPTGGAGDSTRPMSGKQLMARNKRLAARQATYDKGYVTGRGEPLPDTAGQRLYAGLGAKTVYDRAGNMIERGSPS